MESVSQRTDVVLREDTGCIKVPGESPAHLTNKNKRHACGMQDLQQCLQFVEDNHL